MVSFRFCAAICVPLAGGVFAAEQIWSGRRDVSNIWSTNALNWNLETAWVNGNNAYFVDDAVSNITLQVEISGLVKVADITFALNRDGHASQVMVMDADRDGTFEITGNPSVFKVMSSPDFGTGNVYTAISGGGGLSKNGPGVLYLAATNTYVGETHVSQGILRMGESNPNSLGATGQGNGTVVDSGATLDINGATPNGVNSAEPIFLSGSGPDGQGALVNRGAQCMNSGFTGGVTLQGDTTVGCVNRIDVRSTWSGGGYTLTKGGSSELAVGQPVNNCRIMINAGSYTYMDNNALGGSDFNTTLNGGTLRTYGSWTVNEQLVCNSGVFVAAGSGTNLFKLTGRMTLNGLMGVWGENNNMSVEFAGLMEGPGGLSRSGGGSVYVTGNSNTYSGATLISSTLCLGRTNIAGGVFGSGPITNTSNLFIDRSGSFVSSNGFFGSGTTAIRYGGEMIVSASFSSNNTFRVGSGTLTLTNGARYVAYGRFYFADRTLGYSVDPTNITATLNLRDTSSLETYSFEAGNGGSVTGGGMTGTVNQTGGTLRTTGWSGDPVNFPGECDGLRIAHYPQAYGVYNLSGGSVIVDNGYRLTVATDGTGWFRQTGGEVYASEVVVNARTGSGGYGRLTVSGGVLNVGSNGITAGTGAPYVVEYGGAGGIVKAQTNFTSKLNASLSGAGSDAITFDTGAWAVALSGNLSGAGGLSKSGIGTLTLSGTNSYTGPTRVLQGRLVRTMLTALPTNGKVLFGVTPDNAGGHLYSVGDLSLEGLSVGVVNPKDLDKTKHYTVATWVGTLTHAFDGSVLPGSWFVYYDWANKRVELRAQAGTVLRLK